MIWHTADNWALDVCETRTVHVFREKDHQEQDILLCKAVSRSRTRTPVNRDYDRSIIANPEILNLVFAT